ncbi:MAG TPA: nuclear transport factor 2 family protein [Thermoanaerobaculia bacterium]|nr:nuclear transport factor 2 family protein [Thermoanaerobaculia bacterium]
MHFPMIGVLLMSLLNTSLPPVYRDRAAILEHIHGIFRAYLARDRAAIERMHTKDWVGFQGPSQQIERGIADYMRNADRSLQSLQGTGYELLDVEVQLYGDMALVYYVARYDYRSIADGKEGSLRLRSIDVYRREGDGWNQCGSHIAVIPAEQKWE